MAADVLVRRGAALGGDCIRPDIGKARNRIALELRIGNLAPLGGRHQIFGHAVLCVGLQDLAQLRERRLGVARGGQRGHGIAHARLLVRLGEPEFRGEGVACRHHAVQIRPLAAENVREYFGGRVIGRARSGKAVRDETRV